MPFDILILQNVKNMSIWQKICSRNPKGHKIVRHSLFEAFCYVDVAKHRKYENGKKSALGIQTDTKLSHIHFSMPFAMLILQNIKNMKMAKNLL